MTSLGNQAVCQALLDQGVDVVFGLPGSQVVNLYEFLRQSPIRLVTTTHETAAAFAAVGYARASGRPGVLVTIPGPGFAYALAGLAEARLDSVALVHLVPNRSRAHQRTFDHQAIPMAEMALPLVKRVIEVEGTEEIPGAIDIAFELAASGEPGPVLVMIDFDALDGAVPGSRVRGSGPSSQPGPSEPPSFEGGSDLSVEGLGDLCSLIRKATRPVLFLGLGAVPASGEVRELAERLGAPFFTTPSARGVIPEDHVLCLAFDPDRGGLGAINGLLEEADLVVALGCKLSYNGTAGFGLLIPPEKLVKVNSDPAALDGEYPGRFILQASVEEAVGYLLGREGLTDRKPPGWSSEEISAWRTRITGGGDDLPSEPLFAGEERRPVREVIWALRKVLPRDGIVATDSGLHQVLVRRHFEVMAPRGLITPTDFQSMGFGLPAAVGAKLSAPDRPVVAVVGDGGLIMSGMELLTMVREELPITVVVFNDGYLNLIRLQQEREFGRNHAVRLLNPEMEGLADAVGAGYLRLAGDLVDGFREAIGSDSTTLVEVVLGDSPEIRAVRRRAALKSRARRFVGPKVFETIKKLLKTRRR